ncbi:MAG: hypothetical protein J6Y43_03925 [Clostridia bacterium]|nr:hypothetical protein [Clostridia bacterium]
MEENKENVQLSEKETRKQILKDRRMARRAKRNARVARGRFWKNLFSWFLGVIFLPLALVGASFIVPLSGITGSDGSVVSVDLSKKSLFEAVKFVAGNYGELGFADFPVIGQKLSELEDTDIGDGKTLGGIINIDTAKLNAIKFGDEGMADKVRDCVEIVATIDSVGGADMLGDFGMLNIFTDAEEVGTLASIDTTDPDFDSKQYYYKTPSDEYLRAFNDDKSRVAGLTDTETIYYPPLNKVRFSELVDIVDDAFGRLEINSLLDTFHASNETLTKILGEHTKVKDIADFDINEVYLNDVMPKDTDNATLYDILQDLTDKTGEDGYKEITIGDLSSNFNTENIKLTSVLAAPDVDHPDRNKMLYDILRSATNKATNDEITIDSLSDFSTDNIKLTTVLSDTDNADLYDILRSATNKATNDEITLAVLSDSETFKIDNIALTSVLGEYDTSTEKLYDVLSDATGIAPTDITIGDLKGSSFSIDDIKLETVLERITDTTHPDYEKNHQLWTILEAAITPSTVNAETAIRVSDFNTFNANAIKLTTVLPASGTNATLYSILRDVTGETDNDDITVGSLSSFNTDDIHLATVVGTTPSNNILQALVDSDTTLGNIGTKINDLAITDIFEAECFTTDAADAIDTASVYRLNVDGSYTLDTVSGTYYVSANSKVWLFMLYDCSGVSADPATKGAATTYTPVNVKLYGNGGTDVGLESRLETVSSNLMGATVRQLVQTGILTESPSGKYSPLYSQSFRQILDNLT